MKLTGVQGICMASSSFGWNVAPTQTPTLGSHIPLPALTGSPPLRGLTAPCPCLQREQRFLTSHFAPGWLLSDNLSVMLWALIARGSQDFPKIGLTSEPSPRASL